MKNISVFEKQNVLEVYGGMVDFIDGFQGEAEDEEALQKLEKELRKRKIAISKETFDLIEDFMESELRPMVYDYDVVFGEANAVGHIEDGVQHIEDEEEFVEMAKHFFTVLIAKEEALESFAMTNLYPLLVE